MFTMEATVKRIVLCSIFSTIAANSQDGYKLNLDIVPTKGQPWPMPQSFQQTNKVYFIDSTIFQFHTAGHSCKTLDDAIARYKDLSFPVGKHSTSLKFRAKFRSANTITSIDINVKNECEMYPTLESDESYSLTLSDSSFALTSNSIWGAIRGLETFSQLVVHVEGNQFSVNETEIRDFPRFQHRGLLLDTSRHFLDVRLIYETLDAMAFNKMNVFHWHIVDDQSFPYDSKTFPDMSKKGAYQANHFYSQDEVAKVIELARQRGIRVIPEFDTPGHSQSWGKAIKNLLTSCYSEGKFNGNYGPIDPSQEFSFKFLTQFFGEIASVFPDHYIHLGGDEVSFDCWKSNPNITSFMKEKGFGTDYSKLEKYYMERLLSIVSDQNKGYLIWQDVIDNGAKVRMDTVVQVWKPHYDTEMTKVTSLGYKTLLSSCWYLNYISYGSDWHQYYFCDPYSFNGTDAQKKLVMGGEACMWGEYVDNTNVISRTWPRAAVVAERLWSDKSVKDANAAAPRLEEQRCRMIKRGIESEPINGPGYCSQEYMVPSY